MYHFGHGGSDNAMPSEAKPLRQMVALLQAALQDRLDRETVDKHFDDLDHDFSRLSPEGKKVLRKAWEDLLHYIEDEDIPVRDPQYGPEYRRRQREQLSKRIRQLMELLWEDESDIKGE
jgi:protein-tyrosine-phosphatase